jgi:hypothetical protein
MRSRPAVRQVLAVHTLGLFTGPAVCLTMRRKGRLQEGKTMTLAPKIILSPETKATLHWCLALHAQGAIGALAFRAPR